MKPLYVPQSILDDVLPKLSLSAQAVFYASLQKSGVDYQPYAISNAEIRRSTGIKTDESVRKAKREIEKWGIARYVENYMTKADGTRWRTRDTFFPVFDLWESIDKRDGKGLDAETERSRQAEKAAQRAAQAGARAATRAATKAIENSGSKFIENIEQMFQRILSDYKLETSLCSGKLTIAGDAPPDQQRKALETYAGALYGEGNYVLKFG